MMMMMMMTIIIIIIIIQTTNLMKIIEIPKISLKTILYYEDVCKLCEVLPQTLYQPDVSDRASLTTYHSLHVQYLQRSS